MFFEPTFIILFYVQEFYEIYEPPPLRPPPYIDYHCVCSCTQGATVRRFFWLFFYLSILSSTHVVSNALLKPLSFVQAPFSYLVAEIIHLKANLKI